MFLGKLAIDSDERKAAILKEMHNKFGYEGRERTYRRVAIGKRKYSIKYVA